MKTSAHPKSQRKKRLKPIPIAGEQLDLLGKNQEGLTRVVVELRPEGHRILLFTAVREDPYLVQTSRGGTKYWAEIVGVVRWIEKNLPQALSFEYHWDSLLQD